VSQSCREEGPKVEVPHAPPLGDVHRLRPVRLAMWCVAFAVGVAHIWINRRNMCDIDGISYVEIGEAFLRGDWSQVINAHWSPLYGLLLAAGLRLSQVSAEHEIYVLQIVNVVLYAGALTALDFLLRQIIEAKETWHQSGIEGKIMPFPAWGVIALGYALLAWAAAYWFYLWLVSPDIFLCGFFFFAAGIVLRIRTRGANWRRFVALGLVLGVGYLAKAIMFPLALVFLTVAALVTNRLRRNVRYAIAGVITFAVIAAPLATAISAKVGRPTFGEAGRLNYLWNVNETVSGRYWRGAPPGSGTPQHPPRLLCESPRIYEFATPVGGTYPLWYDPAYWYAGATPRFDVRKQISRLEQSMDTFEDQFRRSFQPLLLVGLLLLCVSGGRSTAAATLSVLVREWPLWIPSLVGLALYAVLLVQMRYVAAFVVILWLSLFAAVRIPGGPGSRRRNAVVIAALVAVVLVPTVVRTTRDLAHEKINPEFDAAVQWQYAEAMRRLGIGPGDAVAVIGDGFNAARWARLARVRIIAELPFPRNQERFWKANSNERARILALFEKAGAKAVYAEDAPAWSASAGWHALGDRKHAAFVFRDAITSP
jgi:hypothetical protein